MNSMTDAPMNDLQDLALWHRAQEQCFQQKAARQRELYKGQPDDEGDSIVTKTLSQAEFHRKAAAVAERAYMAELHVQAALL
jgi:hypothetical protein